MGTHKVCLLIFRKYRPPSNPVSAHTILAYTPPPSISVRIKGYMRDIFCESYQRTTNYVKNNGDAVNAIVKRRIKTSRKGLRSRVRFLTVRKRWEWNFLTVLIANFLDFYFATNPWNNNNNNGVLTLTAQPPPNTSQNAFSWSTPAPSDRTYFMDDPTIHRTLREHGMRRKNRVTDISMVLDFFPNELLTSG